MQISSEFQYPVFSRVWNEQAAAPHDAATKGDREQEPAVSIALAHHDLYPSEDEKIGNFIQAWNEHIRRILEDGVKFPELQKELEKKTGITFTISD